MLLSDKPQDKKVVKSQLSNRPCVCFSFFLFFLINKNNFLYVFSVFFFLFFHLSSFFLCSLFLFPMSFFSFLFVFCFFSIVLFLPFDRRHLCCCSSVSRLYLLAYSSSLSHVRLFAVFMPRVASYHVVALRSGAFVVFHECGFHCDRRCEIWPKVPFAAIHIHLLSS